MDEGARVSLPLALLSEFGDALKFLVHERESVTGGAQIGGHEIWLELLPHHLLLTGVSIALACAIAIPLALWLGHIGRGEVIATSVSNVGRAVPSLALIAFFVAYLGVGFTNVTLALVLLAIPPILTNTYVGVRQVDPDVVDSARGMGMPGAEIVRRVELPLALPLIFSGVRTSVVNVVATATIAPLAGYITLGAPIIEANVYGEAGRLGASIVVAALAVACELAFGALERAVTPRGLKLRAGSGPRRRTIPFPQRRAQATP
jgi:osmoprotectant transport system permease protein